MNTENGKLLSTTHSPLTMDDFTQAKVYEVDVFDPHSGEARKVINHLGDEVMKVFKVGG